MQNNHDITVTGDRSEILTWLSPLEPNLRHHAIRKSRVNDVGQWLLRKKKFQRWKNGDGHDESQKATIFCSGNLGVGKTYISSLVIDSLCDEPREDGEEIAVACFYFNSAAQKEQPAASVLGALLKQVIGGFKQIPKEIADAFQRHKKFIGGRELQLPEIVKMLGILSSMQPTFLCLDAIDECTTLDRANILFSLKDIVKMSPTTRVFLTGRPHVGGEVEKHFPERTALVSIGPRNGDIIKYIHKKLAQDANLGEMDEELEAEIVKKILETVSEIFLLVTLNLDEILQETTIHLRRERLRVMTYGWGLGDAYGPTLDRVKAQGGYKSRLGMTALMWICHSERPLGAEELCQALGVEIGSTDYNGDKTPSIRTVLNCCQGFVVMDEEGSTVRLVHHPLQEYLTSHRNLFQNPHSTIAETCLTYLNSQQVMALSSFLVPPSQRPPFLKYSSLYWGAHMKKEPSDCGKTLALRLFSHYKCHISIRLLWRHTLGWYSPRLIDYKFTGLHYASMFGLVEVARALIEMDDVDKNGMDVTGATPLLWAVKSGHEDVAKLLLSGQDVNLNWPDRVDRTPISWASRNGHEVAVKLLLGWEGLSPDSQDTWDRTPIPWAAQKGQLEIVKLLALME